MSHEFDHEPIPGLPAHLPEGENILWQGSPSASATTWRVLHVGWVGAYFAALLAWRLIAGLSDGHTLSQIAIDSIPLTVVAVCADMRRSCRDKERFHRFIVREPR